MNKLNLCGCGCGLQVTKAKNKFLKGHASRFNAIKARAANTKENREENKRKLQKEFDALSDEEKIKRLCKCGCGTPVKKQNKYALGHNSSVEPVGLKAMQAIERTPEMEAYRLEKSREGIEKMKADGRSSERIRKVWRDNRELMEEALKRAGVTRKKRIDAGEIKINKEKISETVSRRYLEGGFKWSRGEYSEQNTKSTKKVSYYRSSWELEMMKHLDNDNSVLEWTFEPFWIRYEFDGKRRYIPDFLIKYQNGETKLVEIGVKEIKVSQRNLAKFEAARNMCSKNGWEFLLITDIKSVL